MEFAKDSRKNIFIREEWPFPDKAILSNHHIDVNLEFEYIYIYLFIYLLIYIFIYIYYIHIYYIHMKLEKEKGFGTCVQVPYLPPHSRNLGIFGCGGLGPYQRSW